MGRKIVIEIEIAGPDLSQQKDIDLLREILTKYYRWAIAGITVVSPFQAEILPYEKKPNKN